VSWRYVRALGAGGRSALARPFSLASTTPTSDTSSQVVAVRDAGAGWIEVDYDDDVAADTSLPDDGIVIQLLAPSDVLGQPIVDPGAGEFVLSLELDAVPPDGAVVSLLAADSTDLQSGDAQGFGLISDGTTVQPRLVTRTTEIATATADATIRRLSWQNVKFNGTIANRQRASTVTGWTAAKAIVESVTEIGASVIPSTYWCISVGHTASGAGGTQTIRFRPRIYAFPPDAFLG